jgi:twitching motility protein PilT
MLANAAIRNLIREDKVAQMYSIIQTSKNIGMQTLDSNLEELVQRGVITREEAAGKAQDKRAFQA